MSSKIAYVGLLLGPAAVPLLSGCSSTTHCQTGPRHGTICYDTAFTPGKAGSPIDPTPRWGTGLLPQAQNQPRSPGPVMFPIRVVGQGADAGVLTADAGPSDAGASDASD